MRHDPAQRPFLVIWEATRACALACRHCRAEAMPGRNPSELDTGEAIELMRQVCDFGRPPPIFVITGGDPFERPDLLELVRSGRELGLPMAVSPSGTPKLTPAALRELHDAGASVISLSLDGARAATHDDFRQVPGTFDQTIAAFRAARQIGLKVQVNTTLARHNLAELPELAALVHELGAMTWSVFLLVPMGRGVDLGELTPAATEDALNFLYDIGRSIPVKTTEGHHFRRVALQRQMLEQQSTDHVGALRLGPVYRDLSERGALLGLANAERNRRPPLNINAASGFVFVSHVGTVHPSGFLPVAAGNVRLEPLTEIYRASPLFTALRDPGLLGGKCGECEYARLCGGSRSRAFAVTGDPHAADPLCAYVPGSFPAGPGIGDRP